MKQLRVLILGIMLAQFVNAQNSFYNGVFVLGANIGVDGNIANQHYFNQPEGSAQTLNGMAPASDFNVTAEYGIFNWLGLGVIGRFDNYYLNNNSVTHTTPNAGAVDGGGTVNLHIIRVPHLDLFAGYDWGLSHFTYHVEDGLNTVAQGNGTWSDIHVTGRIYLDRFGFSASVYAPYMNYMNIENNNSSVGEFIVNYWKSSGYGASVGIQYRL